MLDCIIELQPMLGKTGVTPEIKTKDQRTKKERGNISLVRIKYNVLKKITKWRYFWCSRKYTLVEP